MWLQTNFRVIFIEKSRINGVKQTSVIYSFSSIVLFLPNTKTLKPAIAGFKKDSII
jgi:hypothetical protein